MTINLEMPGGKYIFTPAKTTEKELMTELAKATEEAVVQPEEEDAFAHVETNPAPPKKTVKPKAAPKPEPTAEPVEQEQTEITADFVLGNMKTDLENLQADYEDLKKLVADQPSSNTTALEQENAELKKQVEELTAKCKKLSKVVKAMTDD